MYSSIRRPCPICGGPARNQAFPYATRFNNVDFDYLKCRSCWSVFVDPVPDGEAFGKMYAKTAYHDAHCLENASQHYKDSAKLLTDFLPAGTRVLNYACGIGLFLGALKMEGFAPTRAEFDQAATDDAARNVGCPAFSIEQFNKSQPNGSYDAVHLGDVLEHLPEPAQTLRDLLVRVRPGGILFVEGPIEMNASPVYWAARAFGAVKSALKPNSKGTTPPTRLLRVNAEQQLKFFDRVDQCMSRLHWDVHETGWPYAEGGTIKRAIAGAAMLLGGTTILGITFGNRFRVLFRLPETLP